MAHDSVPQSDWKACFQGSFVAVIVLGGHLDGEPVALKVQADDVLDLPNGGATRGDMLQHLAPGLHFERLAHPRRQAVRPRRPGIFVLSAQVVHIHIYC